jgi:hypothetical protein
MSRFIDVKNIRIDELDLSVRAHNHLVRAKFYTVGDVLSNPIEVINIRNIGQKTLSEIDQVLGTEFCKLLQDQVREINRLTRMKPILKNKNKMKLQIIRETKVIGDDKPWYKLLVDGEYVTGDFDLNKIEDLYTLYKKDPENFSTTRIDVLKSEEI